LGEVFPPPHLNKEAIMATNKKPEAVEETVETVKETDAVEETVEKMVRVKLPREKDNHEDVFVSVNMRTWIVKRGVWVDVPECVAEVLEHQEEMLAKIDLFNDANANE
jgi:hypothetical protein